MEAQSSEIDSLTKENNALKKSLKTLEEQGGKKSASQAKIPEAVSSGDTTAVRKHFFPTSHPKLKLIPPPQKKG